MAPKPPNTQPKRASSSATPLTNPYKTLHKTSKAPTKRLKRESKHATLLSRISKAKSNSKVTKRRRPSKKLVAGLDGLADALPEASCPKDGIHQDGKADQNADGKIKHKSLKSRPGATKRKQKLVAMEMERFGKNMALMAAGSKNASEDGGQRVGDMVVEEKEGEEKKGGSAERWAAIREFITQTMERKPDGETMSGKG